MRQSRPSGVIQRKEGEESSKINTKGEVYKIIQNITHMAESKRNDTDD